MQPLNCDVLVVGAGISGVVAALAAARGGAKTILLENKPFVGGNATTGLCLHAFVSRKDEQVVYGIAQELVDELIARGGAVGHVPFTGVIPWVTPVDGDLFRIVATAKLAEAGVVVIYGVNAVGVDAANGTIASVSVAMKNRVRSIASRIVIDCSGDADVAVAAGANFRSGQEGTGKTQPISMLLRCFGTDNEKVAATMGEGVIARATKADHPTPFPVYFRGSLSKWNEQVLRDKIVHNRDHMVFFNTVWPNQLNVNTTAVFGVDGTDPIALSRATVQLTDQAARIGEFLKRNVDGFQGIHYVPAIFAGVRETRNIIGHYQITHDDVLEGKKFEDSIGEACFPVDIHDPDTGQARFIEIGGDGSFGIPFRSLIPVGLNNTLVAGRCLSADPIASASTRNMGACMVTGEAAGIAAAIAVDRNADFARLDVADIQKEVLRRGGFINSRSGAEGAPRR
jgi:hypothetical protein